MTSLGSSPPYIRSKNGDYTYLRRNPAEFKTTDSEEGDLNMEQKLKSIRRSTRHLKDKLAKEREALEVARINDKASMYQLYRHHQYYQSYMPSVGVYQQYPMHIPRVPTWIPSPLYNHPSMYNPFDAYNPYMSLQHLNYLSNSPVHRLTMSPSLDLYGFNLGHMLNLRAPSTIPMDSETYKHLESVDKLCKKEARKMKRCHRKMKNLQNDYLKMESSSTDVLTQNRCRKPRTRNKAGHY